MIFVERVWYKPCYAIYFRPDVLKTYVIIFLAETYVTVTTTSRTNRSFHRTCPSFKANSLANYFQIWVTGRDSVGAQFKKKPCESTTPVKAVFAYFLLPEKMKDLFLVPDTRRSVLSGWKLLFQLSKFTPEFVVAVLLFGIEDNFPFQHVG